MLFESEDKFVGFRVAKPLTDDSLDKHRIVTETVKGFFFFLQLRFQFCYFFLIVKLAGLNIGVFPVGLTE